MGTTIRLLPLDLVQGENALVSSRLAGPIESLSVLRRSLLFAELSSITYLPRAEAGRLAIALGQIHRLTRWQRAKDRWRGFRRRLRDGRFGHFYDDGIAQYIAHIRSAVVEEERFAALWAPCLRRAV